MRLELFNKLKSTQYDSLSNISLWYKLSITTCTHWDHLVVTLKLLVAVTFSSQLIGFRSEVYPFNYNLTHLDIIINHHESSMSQI